MIADDDVDAQWYGPGFDDGDRLRMAQFGDEEGVGGRTARLGTLAERHRFGRGRSFIEEGGVGDFHPGQVHDHGLEIDQCFQAPLRDLRLVGGVCGVPAGVFQDVALDDRRRDGVGIAHADIGAEDLILGGQVAQVFQHGRFTARSSRSSGSGRRIAAGMASSMSSSSEDKVQDVASISLISWRAVPYAG